MKKIIMLLVVVMLFQVAEAGSLRLGIEAQNLPNGGGVLVTKVYPNQSADKVGIKPQDIITFINEQPINSLDDLQQFFK